MPRRREGTVMIEVELKAHIGDPAAVEAKVAGFARLVGRFEKSDAYWHGPDWRLSRGTKGFRVRTEAGETLVTFKTKRCEGGVEINHEREFSVSDPAALDEFFLRLGCEPFFTKRKRGSRYELSTPGSRHPITIEVLELPGLGNFIEIEALLESEAPEEVALAQGEIRGVLARAGVPESAIEGRYYSELLMSAGLVPRP
jgi:adenylate cyclase class 2